MILHPGILALLSGSTITVVLLLYAAITGLQILRRWDLQSSSEGQLRLEKKTYLVSTLVQYGLFFEIVSLFLFVYTADDLHNLLVGAMCATGSLNADPFGFPALYAGIATLFISAGWIALNYLDNRAEDYPLIRKKYVLLLFIIPFVLAGYLLRIKYFLSLEPNVITSCCGVLFSEGGRGISNSIASLPVRGTELIFYSLYCAVTAAAFVTAKTRNTLSATLLSAGSVLFFLVALASVISFISLYFYQIPTHHCPFDILQPEYYYIGYPVYAALFSGAFFGIMPGVIVWFRKIPSLSGTVERTVRRWAVLSVCGNTLFVVITLVPILFSSFTLE